MAIIEFKQSFEELTNWAAKALRDGKYIICVHNLADAMEMAENDEERATIYKCFSDMFSGLNENFLAQNALFRACILSDKGGYYSLDYDRFFPYDGIIDDEDFPRPDSDTVLAYNDVYNYFITGQYDKGFDILCEIPPDTKSLDEVIGVLYDAINNGKKVDLSAYAYKILLLAGMFATKSGDFVRLMLQGCEVTRSLMVDGARFFADEIEDKRILSDIGRAFVSEGEYECAKICFKKVLEECEIDEIALFYSAAIEFISGEEKKGEQYLSAYKLCYKRFGAPIKIYERMFAEKRMPNYGMLPVNYAEEDGTRFLSNDWDANNQDDREHAKYALGFSSERTFMKITRQRDLSDPTYTELIKETLISPYVPEQRKRKIVSELMNAGFEGRLAVAFKTKASIFDCVKFGIRGNKAIWQKVYEKVSSGIICSKDFLPYKPNYLSSTIKSLAKLCVENNIAVDNEDVPFLCTVLATHYNDKAKNDNNIGWIKDILPPLSGEELKKGLNKFPPEVLKF